MSCADHLGLGIDEKNRRAIGGEDAKHKPRRGADHAVSLQPAATILAGLPSRQGMDDGAMDLGKADELAVLGQSCDHKMAVLRYRLCVVLGTLTAIERGIDAGRDPALPAEEAMHDCFCFEALALKAVHGENPAIPPTNGGANARTLNKRPIWSLPINLSIACKMLFPWSGLAAI